MISMLIPYLRDDAPKALPPYQTFLKQQSIFIRERFKRLYKSEGYESHAVRLLRYIINNADFDLLERQGNNFDRYMYHLRFIKASLDNIFDRISRGRGYRNIFFKSERKTEEFILPVEDLNTLVHLPLDTEDWETWKKVRPVRLWDHNSDEFTVNLLNDRFTFTRGLEPTNAIILIDVVALILKYFIWKKHQRDLESNKELAITTPQQLFLHKYVMCDLIWDNANIWLLNQMNKALTSDISMTHMLFNQNTLCVNDQWGWINSECERAFSYLMKLIRDTSKTFRPEGFLNCKLLFGGNISNRCRFTDDDLNLPLYHKYDYLRFLRDRKLFNIVINVFKLRPDLPATRNLILNVRKDFKRMLVRKPWTVCNTTSLKNEIEDEMNMMYELL